MAHGIQRDQVLALVSAVARRDHDFARRVSLQIAARLPPEPAERIRKAFLQSPGLGAEYSALWTPRAVADKPWYPGQVERRIDALLEEQAYRERMAEEGVAPATRILLSGPPGCGKTMTACWLAARLSVPAYVLALDETISQYMGQTGAHIAKALEPVQLTPAVWLLDELDAVAQKRGASEDGAGKERNVTVNMLCVSLDTLGVPAGLLVATTNRLDVLDPAIVRRFDEVIEWPEPTGQILAAFSTMLGYDGPATTYADVSSGAAKRKREALMARLRAERGAA